MKKIIVCISAIVFITLFLLYVNSFKLAITNEGYHYADSVVLKSGIDDNDKEFRIVKASNNGEFALLYMVKNSIGIWKAYNFASSVNQKEPISIAWIKNIGLKSFEQANDDIIFEKEFNQIYYGENAIKLIEKSDLELLPNVAINIQQSSNTYIIHLVYYGDSTIFNEIDMHSILINAGCIEN